MRRSAATALLLLCPLLVAQAGRVDGMESRTSWEVLKIGAGGFITGIEIAKDGTKVIRTDTYGAYYFNPQANLWQQIVNTDAMPAGDATVGTGQGVYEIAIAPSNTQRFYMLFNGFVFRTESRGQKWTRTNFIHVTVNPNDEFRTHGRRIAVDPSNADVVYVGVPSGLFATSDAGRTWSEVRGIPTPTGAGGILIAFDPTSQVNENKTQTIYVSSYGHGVYASSDGGMNWQTTKGGPTTQRRMIVDQKGTVWLVDDSGGAFKYAASTWSQLHAIAFGNSVAVDPTNASNIVLMNTDGALNESVDGGSTWTHVSRNNLVASDVPWLAWTNQSFFANADMAFDSSASNKLYLAQGTGVWYTGITTVESSITWTSQNVGIEELVANWIVSPPGGGAILTAWDRPVFAVSNPDTYPSRHGINNVNAIVHGWSADWASSAPGTIVVIANTFGGPDTSGYSSDGGRTWKLFESNAPATANLTAGGCISASTPTNFVWVPMDNAPKGNSPWYTMDGGRSWVPARIPGVPATGITGWGFAYYLSRQICAADRVTENTFYIYNDGSRTAAAAGIHDLRTAAPSGATSMRSPSRTLGTTRKCVRSQVRRAICFSHREL